jgi:chemotaxis protein CheD
MSHNRLIVHVSDAKVSRTLDDTLITYSLGSCIGVCMYDAALKMGGMLHFQLPDSRMDPDKAKTKPFMFADSGLQQLIQAFQTAGANKKHLHVKLAGGASMQTGPKGFDIGKRNHLAVKKWMWKHGIFVDGEDVGGSVPRNMYLRIQDGTVTIKSGGSEHVL